MKKILSLFLVLVILLSLCACSKNEAQNIDPSSNLSQSSTDKVGEATNNTTEEEQKPTENSTATSSEGVKETTKQPTPEGNKQEPVEIPIKTPTKEPATAPTDKPNENPADEPNENPTDEPSDCEHTYPTVTCTIPKMCTKCHHIAGKALPHNYKNGSCTVCGMAEMLVTFREGYWVAYTVKGGTSEQGEILSEYVLDPELDRFSSYRCFSNASACFLDKGKITYNDKAYHSDWYFTMYISCTYEENGDTITITVGRGRDAFDEFEFVLKKTSETQLTVISSTNTAYVPVEIVFVKQ